MDLTPQQAVWRWIAAGLWTLQGLAGAMLCARWWSGAWSNPATLPVLFPWTVLMLALGVAAWWSVRRATPRRMQESSPGVGVWSSFRNFWRVWSAELLTGLVVTLSLFPVLAAGTPLAIGVMCGLLATAGLVGWLLNQGGSLLESVLTVWPSLEASPTNPGPDGTRSPPPSPTAQRNQTPTGSSDHVPMNESEPGESEDLSVSNESVALQTMHRQHDDEHEWIEGTVQIRFQPHERETWIHIPIHPPLSAIPEVDAEDADGNGWDLKVSGSYPYGIRLGVRRPPDGAVSGQVAYYASIPLKKCA